MGVDIGGQGWAVVFPGFLHMLPLMCISPCTRFVKTSQLSPTIIVLCRAG